MKIDHIECFRVLAETLNYTNAANRLFMTQSALTRAIQQMEDELGFQLFDRSRRSVTLTPAGQSMYADSQELLDKYYHMIEKAQYAKEGYAGVIKFANHIFRVSPIELDIIHGFQEEYPDIYLDIYAMTSNEMIHALSEGYVDCAIGTAKTADRNISQILLEQVRDCVVMTPEHRLADRSEITFEELRNERFTVMSQGYAGRGYEMISAKARLAGFEPVIEEKAASVAHLLAVIAAGKSITILSNNYKDLAMGRLKFIPLADESLVDLKFMWKTNQNNPCMDLFVQYISDCYAK